MMPLMYAEKNEDNVILKISGKQEIRKHLEDMGFVSGAIIRVISSTDGNVIVSVKDTKVALDRQLASRIMI
ncbi:MAG: ferrous iron transport protein A [Erysipelotrichaceae bacterium]|nr:ferrous iron transport protein A [Erysipelotrichaceae bacterium]MBR5755011.1 ferrous iron transport protein A [Erysipelotrichaceae bacterium]